MRSRWMPWTPTHSAEAPVAGLRLVHLAMRGWETFGAEGLGGVRAKDGGGMSREGADRSE